MSKRLLRLDDNDVLSIGECGMGLEVGVTIDAKGCSEDPGICR